CRFLNLMMKYYALRFICEINTCHLLRSPYNAPPLTGNNDANIAWAVRRFNELCSLLKNKCLTLRAKGVVYAAHANENLRLIGVAL
ncbi:hypothetical protein ACIZNB_004428, partial [Salmonella enterica subsp. enterica serovar Bareilly]